MANIEVIETENDRIALVVEGKYGDVTRLSLTKAAARELAWKLMRMSE
jgi:hypothetical protein